MADDLLAVAAGPAPLRRQIAWLSPTAMLFVKGACLMLMTWEGKELRTRRVRAVFDSRTLFGADFEDARAVSLSLASGSVLMLVAARRPGGSAKGERGEFPFGKNALGIPIAPLFAPLRDCTHSNPASAEDSGRSISDEASALLYFPADSLILASTHGTAKPLAAFSLPPGACPLFHSHVCSQGRVHACVSSSAGSFFFSAPIGGSTARVDSIGPSSHPSSATLSVGDAVYVLVGTMDGKLGVRAFAGDGSGPLGLPGGAEAATLEMSIAAGKESADMVTRVEALLEHAMVEAMAAPAGEAAESRRSPSSLLLLVSFLLGGPRLYRLTLGCEGTGPRLALLEDFPLERGRVAPAALTALAGVGEGAERYTALVTTATERGVLSGYLQGAAASRPVSQRAFCVSHAREGETHSYIEVSASPLENGAVKLSALTSFGSLEVYVFSPDRPDGVVVRDVIHSSSGRVVGILPMKCGLLLAFSCEDMRCVAHRVTENVHECVENCGTQSAASRTSDRRGDLRIQSLFKCLQHGMEIYGAVQTGIPDLFGIVGDESEMRFYCSPAWALLEKGKRPYVIPLAGLGQGLYLTNTPVWNEAEAKAVGYSLPDLSNPGFPIYPEQTLFPEVALGGHFPASSCAGVSLAWRSGEQLYVTCSIAGRRTEASLSIWRVLRDRGALEAGQPPGSMLAMEELKSWPAMAGWSFVVCAGGEDRAVAATEIGDVVMLDLKTLSISSRLSHAIWGDGVISSLNRRKPLLAMGSSLIIIVSPERTGVLVISGDGLSLEGAEKLSPRDFGAAVGAEFASIDVYSNVIYAGFGDGFVRALDWGSKKSRVCIRTPGVPVCINNSERLLLIGDSVGSVCVARRPSG